MFHFTIRGLLLLTLVVGVVPGIAIRWWMTPYTLRKLHPNGQIQVEWWERRHFDGNEVVISSEAFTRYYSNGEKSYEGYAGDPDRSQYWSPTGNPITASEWREFYYRDNGDGTFKDTLPLVDGQLPLPPSDTDR
jgi:hypothetical protein